jgi:membrane associated rhomboid family serine protease
MRFFLPRYRRRGHIVDKELPDARDVTEPEGYVPSEEDFAPSPPKPDRPMLHFPRNDALKPAFICFALFWVASLYEWSPRAIYDLAASGDEVFQKHEYWRLLTALFTHSNVEHLLSNSPLFLIFAWFLYAFFGRLAFPFGAILVGVLSNLWTIYVYDPRMSLVGASGMLYGMIALWLVLYVRFETEYSVSMRIFRSIGVAVLLLFPTTFQQTTSYLAHGTGFLLGLGVGLCLIPFVRLNPNP